MTSRVAKQSHSMPALVKEEAEERTKIEPLNFQIDESEKMQKTTFFPKIQKFAISGVSSYHYFS
jgi:hypothetical protein